eukprot:GHUV01006361.1.p1 GENE.GHUV01006361.1~~GHUV01006361.1.p1  ORF type:complete len:254 (+),score=59.32 GHUV01006361.1:1875-2636(+)
MASCQRATTSLLILIGAASVQATNGPTTSTAAAAKPSGPSFEQPVVTIAPFAPIGELKEYVCAFHLYAHTNARQMQAHHYCSVINGGKLHQCVLYDNSTAGARLMGIEYLIPMDVYAGLPTQEQQLWHSHKYEVKSGMLQSPGMPAAGFKPLLEGIVDMYGKTIHTWQIDASSTLPVGAPQLMMSFIKDGQLKPELQRGFEKRYNFNMVNVAAERADIKPNPKTPLPNADFPWHSGKAWQLKYELVPFHNGTT